MIPLTPIARRSGPRRAFATRAFTGPMRSSELSTLPASWVAASLFGPVACQIERLTQRLDGSVFLGQLRRFRNAITGILSLNVIVIVVTLIISLKVIVVASVFAATPNAFLKRPIVSVFKFILDILVTLRVLRGVAKCVHDRIIRMRLMVTATLATINQGVVVLSLDGISNASLVNLTVTVFTLTIDC